VDHIGKIRDPAALPGWLATHHPPRMRPDRPQGVQNLPSGPCAGPRGHPRPAGHAARRRAAAAERHAALREALAGLPPPWQRLIALLAEDPPLTYTQISAPLGIPAGSIGPTRRRCLAKLRRHPAITALASAGPASLADEPPGQAVTA
jgi:DNA-directed RNA polymerase specialized sigma24 family protein